MDLSTVDAPISFAQKHRKDPNRTVRYTIDMDRQQHKFLKLFAVHNDISGSTIVRALLYLLQTRRDLETLVKDTIFLGETIKNSKQANRAVRYTIDIDGAQHTFIKLFAAHNDTKVSTVMRTMLFLLETRLDLATMLIETIFIDEDDDDDDEIEEDPEN